ncbi:MAG: zinc ABC transporter substrate-binding protein [Microcoleaceae cyanobacterium]
MSIFKNLAAFLLQQSHHAYFVSITAFLMIFSTGCNSTTETTQPTETTETIQITEQNTSPAEIVTTIFPMYLFTKGVTGAEAEVELLVSPNTNIHNYQASPGNIRSVAEAEILIKNGLGIEEFLEKLITNAGNAQLQQINASQGIEVLEEEHDEDHSHAHSHAHEEGNPHVWLDPILAQQQVENIRDGLIAINPDNAQTYENNAAAYLQKMQQLHQQFETQLSAVEGCRFISFHNAYPYLAERYNLQQIAVIELPEDSLSPQDIQQVINTADQYNVKALLSESGISDSRLQQISNDTGLPIKTLDPIENGDLNPQYYFTAMEKNLEILTEVCQ